MEEAMVRGVMVEPTEEVEGRLDEEEVIIVVLDLEGERKKGRQTTRHRGCHGGERRRGWDKKASE